MPAVAALVPYIPAALSVVGGVLGLTAANKAASTQEKAANTARADLMPYNQAGQGALTSLSALLGLPGSGGKNGANTTQVNDALAAWRSSPEYKFGLQAGTDQTQASAAAKGFLQSPGTMEAVNNQAQGYAGNFLDKYIGQLQGIVTGGENAAAGTGQAALQAGQASAAGTVGSANAINGVLGNLQVASLLPKGSTSAYALPGANSYTSPVGSTFGAAPATYLPASGGMTGGIGGLY